MIPTRLSVGRHDTPEEGACVMEVVSLLAGEQFSDLPACTNQIVARVAQVVNDRLGDEERQRLWVLLPRILRARRTASDRRVNVRLACWAWRDQFEDGAPDVALRAVETAEAWLRGEATGEECRAAFSASASASAANAAYAAANAAYAAYAAYANADSVAYAAAANADSVAAANADSVAFLDRLLDAWEQAMKDEGEDLWVPREWEDDAIRFASEIAEAYR